MMKRVRFSEQQIIGVPKEAEAGAQTADLGPRHRVSEATNDDGKAKYSGIGAIGLSRKLPRLGKPASPVRSLNSSPDTFISHLASNFGALVVR